MQEFIIRAAERREQARHQGRGWPRQPGAPAEEDARPGSAGAGHGHPVEPLQLRGVCKFTTDPYDYSFIRVIFFLISIVLLQFQLRGEHFCFRLFL